MTIAATLGRMLLMSLWARSRWSRKYFATARQSFTVPLDIPSDMSLDSWRIRSSDRQLTSRSSEPLARFSDFFVLDLLTVSFPPSVTVGQWSLSLVVRALREPFTDFVQRVTLHLKLVASGAAMLSEPVLCCLRDVVASFTVLRYFDFVDVYQVSCHKTRPSQSLQ